MRKRNNGITLIALVVTIIVLLILAGITIAMLTGENGIVGQARFAEFATEMGMLKEELELYKAGKLVVDNEFMGGTLSCDKSTLFYNTKPEEDGGNIFDCLPSLRGSDYESNIEVTKGKIIFLSQEKRLLDMAVRAGLDVDPYLIIEGELMSSDVNLFMMDDSGTVVVPDRVTKIGAGAFRDLEGLRTIVIPGTVKEISNYAFSANKTLENVIIHEGLQSIGSYAFESCSSLKNVQFPNTLKTIGASCFLNCNAIEEISIPGSVATFPYRLFYGCINLKNITLNEGLQGISTDSFYNTAIAKLDFPSTLRTMSDGPFYHMSKLKEVNIPSSNPYFKYENGMLLSKDEKTLYFVSYDLSTITLPEKLEIIRNFVFNDLSKITSLSITKNVKVINTSFHSNLKTFQVDPANTSFKSVDGNLYDYAVETLIRYCKNEATVRLPNTVKTIKSYSFLSQSNVREIILPDSLETLNNFCISNTRITHLHFPKNVRAVNSATLGALDITISVAQDNPYIQSVNDMYVLTKDGKTLTAVTRNLTSYTLPATVETIGELSFYSKTNLKQFTIPTHVKTIQYSAFDNCTFLQTLEIPSTIQSIDSSAFLRCNSLTNIVIDKKQNEIANAPWGCPFGLRAVKWKQ